MFVFKFEFEVIFHLLIITYFCINYKCFSDIYLNKMSITIKSLTLWRSSQNGRLKFVEIISKPDFRGNYFRSFSLLNSSEDDLVKKLVAKFVADFNIESMGSKIIKTFRELRERDIDGNNFVCEKLDVPQHISCKSSQNHSISDENTVTQSELSQKLATLDKNDKVLKFYEDNKCCVCLNSYKEILDDKLHIVVP